MANYKSYESTPWGEESEYNIYKQIHKVILDEGVTSIGAYAFANFQALSKIKLPDNLEQIGKGAFQDTPLKEIIIPETVTYIGKYAFSSTQLSEIIIPESITRIEDYTFAYSRLSKVTIPESVNYIGDDAFDNTLLEEVVIPKSMTYLGFCSFRVRCDIVITFLGDMPDTRDGFKSILWDGWKDRNITIKYSSDTFDEYVESHKDFKPEWVKWVKQ